MTVLTLQAVENILESLDKKTIERTTLEYMEIFVDQIIDFLNKSFYPRINYNQIDCFNFDAKKAAEKIDGLLEVIERYLYKN